LPSYRFLSTVACLSAIVWAGCGGSKLHATAPSATPAAASSGELRSPEAFAAVVDPRARSQALFGEAARVILSPRCSNCHPAGDSPLQGDQAIVHDPPVQRGPDSHGIPGLECATCHQDHNLPLARVPGAPHWALAPKVMAWVGRSPHAICEQIKDPARNGGRTLAQIVDHSAHDALVGWAWSPGWNRVPAPGTQARFGALMQAWVDSGATCPPEGIRP
jgi:hypothetical protein